MTKFTDRLIKRPILAVDLPFSRVKEITENDLDLHTPLKHIVEADIRQQFGPQLNGYDLMVSTMGHGEEVQVERYFREGVIDPGQQSEIQRFVTGLLETYDASDLAS